MYLIQSSQNHFQNSHLCSHFTLFMGWLSHTSPCVLVHCFLSSLLLDRSTLKSGLFLIYIRMYFNSSDTNFFLKYLFVYLVSLGLSCGIQDLLVAARRLLVEACGVLFPAQGSNPGPLHWEIRVLANGPPEKSIGDNKSYREVKLSPFTSRTLFCLRIQKYSWFLLFVVVILRSYYKSWVSK